MSHLTNRELLFLERIKPYVMRQQSKRIHRYRDWGEYTYDEGLTELLKVTDGIMNAKDFDELSKWVIG